MLKIGLIYHDFASLSTKFLGEAPQTPIGTPRAIFQIYPTGNAEMHDIALKIRRAFGGLGGPQSPHLNIFHRCAREYSLPH